MKKFTLLFGVTLTAAFAQTAQTYVFRAILDPANEVPALTVQGGGNATVWAHVVRNAAGEITAGSVDFKVRYAFGAAQSLTMMHIHRGPAGANGPVVIDSGLAQAPPAAGASGILRYQGQVPANNPTAVQALRDLLSDPGAFYVNVHSQTSPGGVMRGQLDPADVLILMAQMSARNEIPAIDSNASAVGTFVAIAQRQPEGRIASAEVTFDLNYTGVPQGTRFTAMHIHKGLAGVNGPVVIDSGMTATDAADTGNGNLRFENEVNLTPAALDALYGLFSNPTEYYLNIHSTANPGGIMRGQTRNTDQVSFNVVASAANEVPPIAGLDATAPSQFTMRSIRDSAGQVLAGVAIFDMNYRFPAAASFTGMHIHTGLAGANGPVTIDSTLSSRDNVATEQGFGNIYRWSTISAATGVTAMNSVVTNPENHYLNLHTTANPGGAVRAQLAAVSTARPVTTAIISANSDPTLNTVAPYGLMTIFGMNLTKVAGDNAGTEGAPSALNGTSVMVGDRAASIVQVIRVPTFVPTDYIVAQVPGGLAAATYPVVVTNSNGAGNAMMTPVAPVAPGVYFDTAAGIAVRVSDLTLIRPNTNPARPGEMIAVISTGLGQTQPPLEAGKFAPVNAATAATTATFGGANAEVLSSQALPGYIGYYWTVVRVPGAVSGMVPLRLRIGGVDSNTVMIPVR